MSAEILQRLAALERAHDALVSYVARATQWQPQGCDDMPPGSRESFCPSCQTCHHVISGCPGDPGPLGPPGPPGICAIQLPAIGIPSPQSVEQIQVIMLQWDYIAGSECMRRVEIWQHNHLLAAREFSIGPVGSPGPA